MKLLRYFAGIAAAATALVLASLAILVATVTLIESAGDFAKADAGAGSALVLAVYSALQYAYQVMPIACFLGALVAGTLLARRGEILAAQAAGMGVTRLAMAFLAVVVGTALLGAACGEVVVPRAIAEVERVQREDLRGKGGMSRLYNRRLQWFREGDLMLHLPAIDRETKSFPDAVVYRFEDGLMAEVMEAEALRYDQHGWRLEQVRIRRTGDADVTELPVARIALRVKPLDLIDVTGDPRQMTSPELSELIERRGNAGLDATMHRIELHNRFAVPLSALWMFLLVAPWALHPERKRSMAAALGGGVVVIGFLLSGTQVFRLLAIGHDIPTLLGAWGIGLVSIALLPVSFALYGRYRVRGHLW